MNPKWAEPQQPVEQNETEHYCAECMKETSWLTTFWEPGYFWSNECMECSTVTESA